MAPKGKKEQFDIVEPVKPEAASRKTGKLWKLIAVLLVLLMLTGAGFALGVYLKFIDIAGMVDKWNLQDYPVIGRYFTKQQTNFEPVDLNDEQQQPTAGNAAPVMPGQTAPPAAQSNPVGQIDNAEIERLMKARQKEENKRISKLARLYGGMKAEDAVAVLSQLNDNDVLAIFSKMEEEQVSKLLALMEVDRAVRLTEIMLRGQPPLQSTEPLPTN